MWDQGALQAFHTVPWVLLILFRLLQTSRVLPQLWPESREVHEATRSPPEVLWHVPSRDIIPSRDQQLSLSGTSARMSSVKNREAEQSKPRPELPVLVGSGSYVSSSVTWSFTCLISKTSFRLCPPQENPFTCLPQQNNIWHNWLSEEIKSLHFSKAKAKCSVNKYRPPCHLGTGVSKERPTVIPSLPPLWQGLPMKCMPASNYWAPVSAFRVLGL